jgi:predicted CXXCH cytochrome family protein
MGAINATLATLILITGAGAGSGGGAAEFTGIRPGSRGAVRRGDEPHGRFACADCHPARQDEASGAASRPLWSSRPVADGQRVFALYSSRTFDRLRTDIGQPDNASKLCLGCHDGSVSFSRTDSGLVFGPGDLTRSHPISFTYDSGLAMRVRSGGLRDPGTSPSRLGGTIAADLLDAQGKMQCTSCHAIHGPQRPRLLRYEYRPESDGRNTFCRVCHNK